MNIKNSFSFDNKIQKVSPPIGGGDLEGAALCCF
jgi:hypothetical protein